MTLSNQCIRLEYAPWEHVYGYLRKYAALHGITARVRFRTRVLSITKSNLHDAKQPWVVTIEQAIDKPPETLYFDFVVIASGLFSDREIPAFQGQEEFAGAILHADSIKSSEQLVNKKALIVGGSKTAIDMAVNAGTLSSRCDLVFRRIHIILPIKVLRGMLPIRYLVTRFYSFINDPFPFAPHSQFYHFSHRYVPSLFDAIKNFMINDTIISNGPDLYDNGIYQPCGSWSDGLIGLPTQPIFTELKKQNRIQGHLASIEQILDANTVRLDNGEVISPVDMIICGTNRPLRFPFFSQADARTMDLHSERSENFNLYRRIVPIDVPNIAFAGFSYSYTHWMTTEVASHWISDYFKGYSLLPHRDEMKKEIMTMNKFCRESFGKTAAHVQYRWLEPIEIYLKDMNLPLQRTSNWWTEHFTVYRPNRFKRLHEERRARDLGREPSKKFYLSFLHCVLIFFIVMICFLFE